jgi:hypothetical protein
VPGFLCFFTATGIELYELTQQETSVKKLFIMTWLMPYSLTAEGADYCVSTSQQLADALDDAKDNGQDDHIRIRSGDYMILNNERFMFLNQEDHHLVISSGWTPFNQISCFLQLGDPLDTTLDGNDINAVLHIKGTTNFTSQITINNLTITNGHSDATNVCAGLMF